MSPPNSPLHPVQSYPPTLRARSGHDLVAMPLHREAPCAKCPRGLTIVGYLDRRTRKTWPTCWSCAQEAVKGARVVGEFETYDD